MNGEAVSISAPPPFPPSLPPTLVFLPVVGREGEGQRKRLLFQGLQVVEESSGINGHREAWGEAGKE